MLIFSIMGKSQSKIVRKLCTFSLLCSESFPRLTETLPQYTESFPRLTETLPNLTETLHLYECKYLFYKTLLLPIYLISLYSL